MTTDGADSIPAPSSSGGRMASTEHIDPVLMRVARALAMSQGSSDWHEFVLPAQAMLRALREPSDEMLEAGAIGMPDWGDLPTGWRAMIDHVLGEEAVQFNDNTTAQAATKATG